MEQSKVQPRPYKPAQEEAEALGKILLRSVEILEKAANTTKDPEVFKILHTGFCEIKDKLNKRSSYVD